MQKYRDKEWMNILLLGSDERKISDSARTDCMIICTGTSSRHVMSIADHVVQESRAAGLLPLGVEGENSADWIVVDLGDVIVHVMQEESRRLYELEKLWS